MKNVTFHVAPENQGQIVEYGYALSDGGDWVICRERDRSNNTVSYFKSRTLKYDEGDYWNAPPRNKRWRKISEKEALELMGN